MNALFLRRFHLLALLAAPTLAHATAYNWPDVAPPCNTVTLQACINAVAANDIVNVITSATLTEPTLSISKPLTLRAAPGQRPVLAAGTSISAIYTPAAGTNWALDIEGFTLLDGAVSVQVGNGNATVTLRRFDITSLTQASPGPGGGANSGIGIRDNGSGSVTYEVAENRIRTSISSFSQPHALYVDATGGGTLDGRIHDNRISHDGVQAGSSIVVYPKGASTTRFYANQISGSLISGFQVFPQSTTNLAHTLVAIDNAVTCSGNGYGIFPVAPGSGSLDVQVFNNSVTNCQTGFGFSNSGTVTGRVANNVFAYNGTGINLAGFAGVSNDHNLVYANTNNFFTPGAGTVTGDPLLRRSPVDARLTTGSPAIDAADSAALRTLLGNNAIGEIDADGSRRFKGATDLADIGAFEFGDFSLAQRKVSGASSYSTIDNTALNGNASARPQLTPTRMADSYQAASNNHYTGIDYLAPNYQVHNEGSVLFTPNSAFNVFAPAPGAGVFMHSSTVGNINGTTTQIDNPYLNNQPNRIVLATHRPGTAFDEPFAAAYFLGNRWYLWRTSLAGDFLPGLDFHVYAQDPSLNAFHWQTPETGNTSYTVLDQLTINGEPCAQVHATSGLGQVNPHPIELRYVSALKRWRIENTDNALLGANADFFVVVDEAATVACRWEHIFHHEFEAQD